jgi:TolB-like protein
LRYLFQECALDTDRRELWRGAELVAIEPQVFDLLVHLIQHRDRVVSKDDLLASVWHGRAISESALFNRINAARSAIGDTGERQGLIKTLPRRGLRFVGAVREEDLSLAEAGPRKPSPGIADKPSIAVLPFINLSGDPEQDYFIDGVDGVVEDIITALSRNRAFFVIARNSSFTYKGKAVDTKQIARELGVRYVLEGSVRKSGNRVRVTGQFIEAESGRHLWADRFDGDLLDIFDLQDQLVTSVVGAIAPQLEKAEIDRAKLDMTGDLAAYDFYLRGLASWNRWTSEDNARALQLFTAAIAKDDDFSTPYGLAASCHHFAKANGWAPSFDEAEISRLVERAAAIGTDDAVALCWAGHVHAYFFHDLDRALLLIDRALELDVNLAVAWQRSGWVRGYAGDSDGAIASLNKAIRLNPLDPRVFLTQSAMAFAHFIAGRDDESARWAAMALRVKPNWMPALRMTIASNAMRGQTEHAKRALNTYLGLDPEVSITKLCEYYPFRRGADRQRFVAAMRKVGISE